MNNIFFKEKNNILTQKSKIKIGISIIVLYTIFMFIISYGNCDAFFPSNIINFTNIIFFGGGISSNTIGYQSFAAIICILSGLSPTDLIVFPILTIPIVIIITLLVYQCSKDMLITGFIVPFILSLYFGLSNTFHIIWIHAFGIVLFFFFVYLTYLFCRSNKLGNKYYTYNITICLFLVLFTSFIGSYDTLCNTLLFLSVIFIILFFHQSFQHHISPQTHKSPFRCPHLGILFILLIFSVAYIILLNSGFLSMFIGFSINLEGADKISIVDKFINLLSSYFGNQIYNNDISYLFQSNANPYEYQKYIAIPRYILSGIILLIYTTHITKLFKKSNHTIPIIDILIISIFFSLVIYILIRIIFVGQLTYSAMFLPLAFMFCRILILKDKSLIIKIGKILIAVILILWVSTTAGTYYYNSNIYFADKINTNYGLNAFEKWDTLYSNEDMVSDVYSFGYIQLLSQINNPLTILHNTRPNRISVFQKHKYILSLVNPIYHEKVNALINWGLIEISASTADWLTLKSWTKSKKEIFGNPNYDITYSNGISSYLKGINF